MALPRLTSLVSSLLLLGLAPAARAEQSASPTEPQDSWLDVGHAFLERTLLAPVLRFDRFFSDERDPEPERARSFLRWRNEIRLTEGVSNPAFTTGVRANLRLPGLNRRFRRFRIVIAGETRDAVSALFPAEPAKPATEGEPPLGSGDAGLRLDLLDSVLAHVDLGGGVLMDLPPGVYGRLRLKWAVPIPRVLLSRWALSGFWRTDTRFGTSAALDLDRPLGPRYLARLSGGATLTEESAGAEWNAEAVLLASLGPRSGAALGGGPNGATEHVPSIDRWRVFGRFRTDVYRRWIFVEAEPEVAWPWSPDHPRRATFAVAFRLELQFEGTEREPAPPPPPQPEPAGSPERG